MVLPVEDESKLQNLQQNHQFIREKFLDDVEQVRSRVFKKIKPKILNGNTLKGKDFLQLTKIYLQMINQGLVPDLKSAWQYILIDSIQSSLKSKQKNKKKIVRKKERKYIFQYVSFFFIILITLKSIKFFY